MSKKDKKIEIQINDAKVVVNKATIEGFELLVGKKVIGQIVEIDGKFAVVDKENVVGFHKKMDDAVPLLNHTILIIKIQSKGLLWSRNCDILFLVLKER